MEREIDLLKWNCNRWVSVIAMDEMISVSWKRPVVRSSTKSNGMDTLECNPKKNDKNETIQDSSLLVSVKVLKGV